MNNMTLENRLRTAERLEKQGKISIGNDIITVNNGLVYVNDEPMTWDTFTHLYLLTIQD